MDKIYTGDIPSDYVYARFSDGHIDLYKNTDLYGEQDFYRIYMYDNSFNYEHLTINYNEFNRTTATLVDTTNNWYYRRDMPSIIFMSCIYCLILVLLFNIVSSVFKKGGLLGGLL